MTRILRYLLGPVIRSVIDDAKPAIVATAVQAVFDRLQRGGTNRPAPFTDAEVRKAITVASPEILQGRDQ